LIYYTITLLSIIVIIHTATNVLSADAGQALPWMDIVFVFSSSLSLLLALDHFCLPGMDAGLLWVVIILYNH